MSKPDLQYGQVYRGRAGDRNMFMVISDRHVLWFRSLGEDSSAIGMNAADLHDRREWTPVSEDEMTMAGWLLQQGPLGNTHPEY